MRQLRMREHLKIHHPHLMPGLPGSPSDPLQAQRLQAQEDLRVHQRTGMNEQQTNFHLAIASRTRKPGEETSPELKAESPSPSTS